MSGAWFVRRFPVGDRRNAMTPVGWRGWGVMAAFAGAMVVAALAFLLFALTGSFLPGLIVFAVLAGAALYGLLWIVKKKGDVTKAVQQPPPLTIKMPTLKPAPKPAPTPEIIEKPAEAVASEPVAETTTP